LLIEVAIFPDRKCREEIEYQHISAIFLDIFDGIDHISDSLAHLLSIDGEVTRDEKLMWEIISCTTKHRRPVDRMESHDIFSDDMQIG
jgi:hypothetical protein